MISRQLHVRSIPNDTTCHPIMRDSIIGTESEKLFPASVEGTRASIRSSTRVMPSCWSVNPRLQFPAFSRRRCPQMQTTTRRCPHRRWRPQVWWRSRYKFRTVKTPPSLLGSHRSGAARQNPMPMWRSRRSDRRLTQHSVASVRIRTGTLSARVVASASILEIRPTLSKDQQQPPG